MTARVLKSTGSAPLNAHLVSLVIRDDDANTIRDLVNTGTTWTPHANVTFGDGDFGKHFQTSGSGYTAYNVTADTPVPQGNAESGHRLVIIYCNEITARTSESVNVMLGNSAAAGVGLNNSGYAIPTKGSSGASSFGGSANLIDAGSHVIAVQQSGDTYQAVWVDGTKVAESTSGVNGLWAHNASLAAIGGFSGENWCAAKFFAVASLRRTTGEGGQFSDSDVAALMNSATGGGDLYFVESLSSGIDGSAAITEAADTLSADGVVGDPGEGAAAITEAADTLSADGTVPIDGAAAITEAADTLSAAGSSVPGITFLAIRDHFRNLRASESGVVVCAYNPADGALVVRITGQSTDASGNMTVGHASLSAATAYKWDIEFSDGTSTMPEISTS